MAKPKPSTTKSQIAKNAKSILGGFSSRTSLRQTVSNTPIPQPSTPNRKSADDILGENGIERLEEIKQDQKAIGYFFREHFMKNAHGRRVMASSIENETFVRQLNKEFQIIDHNIDNINANIWKVNKNIKTLHDHIKEKQDERKQEARDREGREELASSTSKKSTGFWSLEKLDRDSDKHGVPGFLSTAAGLGALATFLLGHKDFRGMLWDISKKLVNTNIIKPMNDYIQKEIFKPYYELDKRMEKSQKEWEEFFKGAKSSLQEIIVPTEEQKKASQKRIKEKFFGKEYNDLQKEMEEWRKKQRGGSSGSGSSPTDITIGTKEGIQLSPEDKKRLEEWENRQKKSNLGMFQKTTPSSRKVSLSFEELATQRQTELEKSDFLKYGQQNKGFTGPSRGGFGFPGGSGAGGIIGASGGPVAGGRSLSITQSGNIQNLQGQRETSAFKGDYSGILSEDRRKAFEKELQNNSTLKRQLYSRARNEVGTDPENQKLFLETIFNRAMFQKKSLSAIVNQHAYFPSVSMKNRNVSSEDLSKFDKEVLGSIMGGSNETNMATDNASLDVARRRIQSGTVGAWLGKGKKHVSKDYYYRGGKESGKYRTTHGIRAEKYATMLKEREIHDSDYDEDGVFVGNKKEPGKALPSISELIENKNKPMNFKDANVVSEMKEYASGKVNQHQMKKASIRKRPISDKLQKVLDYASAEAGVEVDIWSGGQRGINERGKGKRTGSTRHDYGNAADLDLYIVDKSGKRVRLDPRNPNHLPIMQKFVESAASAGATGIGHGGGYMGHGRLHVGFGTQATWGGGMTNTQFNRAFYRGRKNQIDINDLGEKTTANTEDILKEIEKKKPPIDFSKPRVSEPKAPVKSLTKEFESPKKGTLSFSSAEVAKTGPVVKTDPNEKVSPDTKAETPDLMKVTKAQLGDKESAKEVSSVPEVADAEGPAREDLSQTTFSDTGSPNFRNNYETESPSSTSSGYGSKGRCFV
jgi:predicted  nucleic acid-binding Zn-ribbon protein